MKALLVLVVVYFVHTEAAKLPGKDEDKFGNFFKEDGELEKTFENLVAKELQELKKIDEEYPENTDNVTSKEEDKNGKHIETKKEIHKQATDDGEKVEVIETKFLEPTKDNQPNESQQDNNTQKKIKERNEEKDENGRVKKNCIDKEDKQENKSVKQSKGVKEENDGGDKDKDGGNKDKDDGNKDKDGGDKDKDGGDQDKDGGDKDDDKRGERKNGEVNSVNEKKGRED